MDDDSSFQPRHPVVAGLHHALPGLRVPRTEAVLEAVVATIVEQKVAGMDAWRSYRALVRSLGEPAPGPAGLMLPPDGRTLARTPYFVFHRFGLERRRAEAIRFAAARASSLEAVADVDLGSGRTRLLALPGVGPWSAAEVMRLALGDADAVSVGDYHLPHMVTYAFTGERKGSDERMLELLEPYRGHRGRVQLLLEAGGIGPPRRGPRMPLRNLAPI
jgi:3-methyladenine DNA glycosylase/8-oxoguanine DNA glycosylase